MVTRLMLSRLRVPGSPMTSHHDVSLGDGKKGAIAVGSAASSSSSVSRSSDARSAIGVALSSSLASSTSNAISTYGNSFVNLATVSYTHLTLPTTPYV